MLVKLTVCTSRRLSELVSAALFQAGAGGIEELDGGRRLVVYAETREAADSIASRARAALAELGSGANGLEFNVEVDESSDWASAWTRYLGQVALTPRLVIQPLWDETPAPLGARRILFDPKLSFGDGAHPTTRLAALALERACRQTPHLRVLDFGSGTGVLSFVALLSGARAALGIDIDPVSVEAAQRNAALNGLGERARFALAGPSHEDPFDLVVANLEAPSLIGARDALLHASRAASRMLITGFLRSREAEMSACFEPSFEVEGREREDDWSLLELRRVS